MDTLTPAAPWVALLLAVVALALLLANAHGTRRRMLEAKRMIDALTEATNVLASSVLLLQVEVKKRALKRPARKPTPLADSERLLAGAARQAAGEGE